MVNPLLFGMQSNAWYFVGIHIVFSEYLYARINVWQFAEGMRGPEGDWTR